MNIKDYKDLKVWQLGIEIVNDIYLITQKFPAVEQYGLSSQMRRSSVSVPSNIAEGFARQHRKEYSQFLSIALGSCAELDTQLIIARNLKYVEEQSKLDLVSKVQYEMKMIKNLSKSVLGIY